MVASSEGKGPSVFVTLPLDDDLASGKAAPISNASHSAGVLPRAPASFMSFLITPSASIAIQEHSSWRVELRAVLALAFPVILQVG